MNRNFLLLTGLLICCCVPTNDFIVRTMRGGGDFPLLISGAGNILRERIVLSASRGGEAGKNNADPAPATAGITQARSPRKSKAALPAIATGAFLLLAAISLALRQKHQIKRLRAQHAQTDARLHELSEQLAASSLRHETATRELSQANTIKDKYLRYYMQRSTFYINKLERHRTHLYKTALSYGQERLLRELRSPTPIEQEYKSFFHEFDRVFLSLYPDFVEKANALLRDGEQMKTPGLNTEFRLLAVIRLGITGNSEIAQFLHISINTVYTYRNRLRNAAKCPPAEFERRIMEIV